MAVPLPPAASDLDPLIEVWPPGRQIVRIHAIRRRPTEFNPGPGGSGRFHPVRRPDGSVVPWLYGAEDDEGAICETVFHDVPFVPDARVSEAALAGQAISTISPRRNLRLALLAGLGLRRVGISRADLIESPPVSYAATAIWAQVLHDSGPAPDGLVWRARPNDERHSLVLFGDRVAETDLSLVEDAVPLALGEGYERVLRIATLARVTIVPVGA